MLEPDEVTAMLRLRKLGGGASVWRESLAAHGRRASGILAQACGRPTGAGSLAGSWLFTKLAS